MRTRPLARALATLASVLLLASACGSPPQRNDAGGPSGANAATATSAADVGGMDALVAAAKKEGALNTIALPPDWANYGEMMRRFTAKYGVKVNNSQPDANSQDEINAAKQLARTDRAPDVFDLGLNVALANTAMFAPYKVTTWDDIPANLKDADGRWFSDYGGYMSIGYDAKRVPAPATVADLLKPAYKGKVALNGDPLQAAAAFNGVMMASLANGGSADDVAPGVEFFRKLKAAGNLLPVDPTPATIESGQTPVVFDWDYNHAAQAAKPQGRVAWRVLIPANAVVGSYYVQAVNKEAPHPAAARLWQEFLFSDEGQNIWLGGFARPVRVEAMQKARTVDTAALAKLPKAQGTPVFLTTEQSDKAKSYLATNWSKAVG